MAETEVVYVTGAWGVHDARWMAALHSLGFQPMALSLDRDASGDPVALRTLVEAQSGPARPILAGPLSSVTSHLVGLPGRLVGLSWGYDLHDLDAAGDDLSWLTQLNGLIVDSEATAAIATAHGLKADRVTMLPWGVDLDVFTPDGPRLDRAAFGLPEKGRLVLSLRAHEPIYRVGDVIDGFVSVASELPDAVLVVGHDGSLTATLRDQAAALGVADRVHFIGHVDESVLPALLRASSCYVTAAQVDGTSVTLLQAMACGVPVVASDSAGNQGWVAPGRTGYLFGIGDTTALGQAIKTVLGEDTTALTTAALTGVQARANWTSNLPHLAVALRD